MKYIVLLILCCCSLQAQEKMSISVKVTSNGEALPYVNIYLKGTVKGAVTNENGDYRIKQVKAGDYTLVASFTGFKNQERQITIEDQSISVNFHLEETESLDEVVITGTLKPVSRLDSAVPVEIYTPVFLKQNPTPNIFEALQ